MIKTSVSTCSNRTRIVYYCLIIDPNSKSLVSWYYCNVMHCFHFLKSLANDNKMCRGIKKIKATAYMITVASFQKQRWQLKGNNHSSKIVFFEPQSRLAMPDERDAEFVPTGTINSQRRCNHLTNFTSHR